MRIVSCDVGIKTLSFSVLSYNPNGVLDFKPLRIEKAETIHLVQDNNSKHKKIATLPMVKIMKWLFATIEKRPWLTDGTFNAVVIESQPKAKFGKIAMIIASYFYSRDRTIKIVLQSAVLKLRVMLTDPTRFTYKPSELPPIREEMKGKTNKAYSLRKKYSVVLCQKLLPMLDDCEEHRRLGAFFSDKGKTDDAADSIAQGVGYLQTHITRSRKRKSTEDDDDDEADDEEEDEEEDA